MDYKEGGEGGGGGGGSFWVYQTKTKAHERQELLDLSPVE